MMIVGLSWGIAVGSGLVAFITVLDIIPRLVQITRSYGGVKWFEGAVVSGAMFWTAADMFSFQFAFSPLGTSFIGLMAGVFVGMLAAALTEVLNVFPILAKRLHIEAFLVWLLMAMVFGKILGSLFDWLVYYK